MRKFIFFLLSFIITACSPGSSDKKLEQKLQNITISWESQKSGTNASLRGVSAVNSSTVWASGSNGTYLKTTDAGKTWKSDTIPGASSLDFRDVEAVDKNTAYLLSAGNPAKIYKTIDGGITWLEQYSNETEGVFFDAMAFWDEKNGIAFSDPVNNHFLLIRTSDGGAHWEQIPVNKLPAPNDNEAGFAASGSCIAVFGKKKVWFGTGGSTARVISSRDKGKSWTVAETPVIRGKSSTGIFSLIFTDRLNGIAVGGDYREPGIKNNIVALTTDGGRSWIKTDDPPPSGFRSCIASNMVKKLPVLITVGINGSDYSLDMGKSWIQSDTTEYNSISFAKSGSTGWAVGPNGKIAKCTCEYKTNNNN